MKNIPPDQKRITLSTTITILRIIFIPLIVFLIIKQKLLFAFIIIIISAISDIFDGHLARKRNETTVLGACLDPIADKLLVLTCYILFSFGYIPNFKLPFWFTLIIFIKEIFLILGGILMYNLNKAIEIKPNILGKLAMDIQIIFIIFIFLSYFFDWKLTIINNYIIFIVLIFVLLSFIKYAKINMKYVVNKF